MKKTIAILALALVLTACQINLPGQNASAITLDQARVKTTDFINKNLMQPGQTVSIKEAVEEDGLYKIVVNMANGQEIVTYLTKDGKKFFPQVMEIEKIEQETQANQTETGDTAEQPAANLPKSAKPVVELFVMSHCPFGTQIEKGILPVLDTLKDKVDFTLKFCDYAMHGKKELDEQLNQYCIQEEYGRQKLEDYLKCFLADETKSSVCMKDNNIDETKIKSCVAAADKEFKVTAGFNDQSTWVNGRFPVFALYQADNDKYGVKGSPTLVVNGTQASSARDPQSLLKAICGAFETPPSECTTALSAANPSAGFGYGTDPSGTAANCE